MTPFNDCFINDVPFGQKDYRIMCQNGDAWERLDMQKRRVEKLSISLKGFFDDTYRDKKNSLLYAQSVRSKGTYYPVFITLTYRDQDLWDAKDISKLVDVYRKDWIQRLGRDADHFRYVWVAEMQKRGVIHYHLVLWCPRGKSLKKPDSSGIWTKGMSNIVGVKKGVIGYLSKYLSKGSQPAEFNGKKVYFPKGARIFGMGGLSVATKRKIAYQKLPRFVRAMFDHADGRIHKVLGGYRQGTTEIVSNYTFQVIKMNPEVDPYTETGWRGGSLTIIAIYEDVKHVLLCDKEDYLNVSRET